MGEVELSKHIKRLQDMPLSTYVAFSIAVLLIYTVISLILSVVFGVQNETLTTCMFGTFGGECLTCGVIKVFKLHKEYKINRGIEP